VRPGGVTCNVLVLEDPYLTDRSAVASATRPGGGELLVPRQCRGGAAGIKPTMQPRNEKYRLHKVGDKWRLLPP